MRARRLGAEIIVVHGETIVEPVIPGTNHAAVSCPEVDILAHPGLITVDDAEIARENGVTLEISARKGHCLGNGHVASVAREVGVPVVIDTDTHAPGDLLDYDMARRVGLGAGLDESEVEDTLVKNPRKLLKGNGII